MIQEKVTIGAGTEFPLKGMITFPDDISGPFPAVVMVHGSGPNDMDERVMKLTPFKDLAEGLCVHGIASLRYDKRTFTYAKKLSKTQPTAREETISDALSAIELLKSNHRIDPQRIYLLGHSLGAMLAPRIDAEGGNVAGIIMLAGSPYRLEDIVLRQLKQTQNSNSLLKGFIGFEYRIYSNKFSSLYEISDDEAKRRKFAGNISLFYFREMGRKTAADYLSESTKPVLFLQGGKDFQVLANDDFNRFRELFSDREKTYFKLYPELNHCFVQGIYDDILKASKEYSIERHIVREVFKDIAEFVLNRSLSEEE